MAILVRPARRRPACQDGGNLAESMLDGRQQGHDARRDGRAMQPRTFGYCGRRCGCGSENEVSPSNLRLAKSLRRCMLWSMTCLDYRTGGDRGRLGNCASGYSRVATSWTYVQSLVNVGLDFEPGRFRHPLACLKSSPPRPSPTH